MTDTVSPLWQLITYRDNSNRKEVEMVAKSGISPGSLVENSGVLHSERVFTPGVIGGASCRRGSGLGFRTCLLGETDRQRQRQRGEGRKEGKKGGWTMRVRCGTGAEQSELLGTGGSSTTQLRTVKKKWMANVF